MKKLLLFVLISICIFIPSQVFAAPLEIHGDVTKSLSLEDFTDNTDILSTLLAGKYSLELSLNTKNDILFKAGVKNIGADPNLNYTRNQSYYVDFSSPIFSIWFNKGLNEDYPLVSLGDPMGVGDLKTTFGLNENWQQSYMYSSFYDFEYNRNEGIIPDFQVGVNLNLGKFNLVGSYGKYYILEYNPELAVSNPLSNGLYNYINASCDDTLNILMLRGTIAFSDYFNLGLSFINYNKDDASSCGLNEGYSNLILDITGDNPYIGGNYVLALLGTIEGSDSCSSCDDSFFVKDGFGVYAALKDIPIGKNHQFKLGLDFAGAQEYCGSCLYNNHSYYNYYVTNIIPDNNFLYDSLRFGATLATTVDLEEFGYIDYTLRNYLTSEVPYNDPDYPHLKQTLAESLLYNMLSLEADLNTPNGSNANLIAAFTYDIQSPQDSNLFTSISADVAVNDNFTINGKVWVQSWIENGYTPYSLQLGAIGNWDLPTNDHVASADYTIGAMAGFMGDNVSMPEFKSLAYMELNSRFTNNLGLSMAAYLDYNLAPYVRWYAPYKPSLTDYYGFTFVATATGEYWFTDKLALSLTGTYRNWEVDENYPITYDENPAGTIGTNDVEEHSFYIKNNFFAMVALTYNFNDNANIQLSLGKSGLADAEVTDPAKYPNAKVYPWMKLSIAPRYGEMDWKALKFTVSIKF